VKKNHVRKNRALLLLSRKLRKKREEEAREPFQKEGDKVRRIAKRITGSEWIRVKI